MPRPNDNDIPQQADNEDTHNDNDIDTTSSSSTMDALQHFRSFRRRPLYQKLHSNPATYLTTARLHLLQLLPPTHRLYSRSNSTGILKPPSHALPDIPRVPFTESELEEIKYRRRYTADPDDVRYQLQDSKLVNMWNADYEREEQWREYDEAKEVMEMKKEVAGLPEEMFDREEIVEERRRKVVAEGYVSPVRSRSLVDDMVVEEMELEHGEIEEMSGYIGDLDELEDEEIEAESFRTLQEMNDRLRAANEAMRVMAGGLQDDMLPLSPPTGGSESSGDESDDSIKAICEFDLGDPEEEEHEHSGRDVPVHVNSWLNDMDPKKEESTELCSIQEEKGETQFGHELC